MPSVAPPPIPSGLLDQPGLVPAGLLPPGLDVDLVNIQDLDLSHFDQSLDLAQFDQSLDPTSPTRSPYTADTTTTTTTTTTAHSTNTAAAAAAAAQQPDRTPQQHPSAPPQGFPPTPPSHPPPAADTSADPYAMVPNHNMAAAAAAMGAGPLPTGFGLPPHPPPPPPAAAAAVPSNSTLSEFTKRRNWTQRVLDELRDLLHILTPDGRILYASASSRQLTGYEPKELAGRFVYDFIHQDDRAVFVREFNESIASGNPLRFFYRFRKADGSFGIFECHGHPHLAPPEPGPGPVPLPPSADPSGAGVSAASSTSAAYCRGFFMMARPYPTKNTALLDSFLEHKIENERLTRRIADLRREEQEENEAAERSWRESGGAGGSIGTASTSTSPIHQSPHLPHHLGAGPGNPAGLTATNPALTRQNLDEALAAHRPDSITDKMARYEGGAAARTHLDQIEMLTGLRYRDGERSMGISTGDASPLLIKGDAGIAIPIDSARGGVGGGGGGGGGGGSVSSDRDRDRKKKIKVADEYVCTDCGTLDSPEWRKGPMGPKTLCNACGLRWAKKEKKRQQQQQQQENQQQNGTDSPSTTPVGHASASATQAAAAAAAAAAQAMPPPPPPSLQQQQQTQQTLSSPTGVSRSSPVTGVGQGMGQGTLGQGSGSGQGQGQGQGAMGQGEGDRMVS